MHLLLFILLLLLTHSEADADFYKYQAVDGVEVFTNTPTTSDAVKIIREDSPRRVAAPARKKAATHKSAHSAQNQASTKQDQEDALLRLPVSGTISSNYGWRHDPIDGNLKHHSGVDIAVRSGTPVKSIAPGRVSFSGTRGGYGNLVIIEHDNGMVSLYGHNSLILVTVGENVDAHKTIALSGSTGRSTGPHLHFELWKNGDNLTQAYVQSRSGNFTDADVASSRVQHDEIRRFVEKNGTLVFTNLPQ